MSMLNAKDVATAVGRLGLEVIFEDGGNTNAFVPGVWLDEDGLHVCSRTAQPGDILHEAAHLAIIPSRFRQFVRPGPLELDGSLLFEKVEEYSRSKECFDHGPDHWLMRALIQMSDCEAQAWSYAAALKIGYSTREAFCFEYPGLPRERQPYQGEGEDLWRCLEFRQHPGINGMHHSGMTT